MNRAVKTWQLAVAVLLSGCIPMNINQYSTNYTVTVVEERTVGVFCENKSVLNLKDYDLPAIVNVDDAATDQEVVDRLVGHIKLLRSELDSLTSNDYKCTIVQ